MAIRYWPFLLMRAKMRNIILAVIIAVGAGAILYLLATVLGLPDAAKGVAGLPAFAIQKVYELLEARSESTLLKRPVLARP
jgi:hypothetical protein